MRSLTTRWPVWLNRNSVSDTWEYRRLLAKARALRASSTRRGGRWLIDADCVLRDFEALAGHGPDAQSEALDSWLETRRCSYCPLADATRLG